MRSRAMVVLVGDSGGTTLRNSDFRSSDVRSGRRSRITSPQKEKIDTAYRRWEEPSFTRQSRRRSSPVPQEEMNLTDDMDLPPTTRRGRESDREDPYARARVRIEPPLSPLRENTISKKNRASRYSMETPCIHVDPYRATRSHYEPHRAADFEAPPRTHPPRKQLQRRELTETPEHPGTGYVHRNFVSTFSQTTTSKPTLRDPETRRDGEDCWACERN